MGLILALLLVWTTPTTRTDGSELQPHEIGHFSVSRNGEAFTVTTETHTDVDRAGVYRVRCIDVHGRVSMDSNALKIKGKDLR